MCSLLLEEKDWSVAVGGCGQRSRYIYTISQNTNICKNTRNMSITVAFLVLKFKNPPK